MFFWYFLMVVVGWVLFSCCLFDLGWLAVFFVCLCGFFLEIQHHAKQKIKFPSVLM